MNLNILHEANIPVEVLETVNAIVIVLDEKGRIVFFNSTAEKISGYTFTEVENKFLWDLFALSEEATNVRINFSLLSGENHHNTYTSRWLTRNDEQRLIDWSDSAVINDNEVKYVIATGIDVTEKMVIENQIQDHLNNLEDIVKQRTDELSRANLRLDKLVNIDGLTNIHNRRYFDETLTKELSRAKRSGAPLSLLLCDVDYFKAYNDSFGHIAGDKCLIEIATVFKRFFNRASDFVARYGGEEFAVILPNMEADKALSHARSLVAEIRQKNILFESSPGEKVVTISAGTTTFKQNELTETLAIIDSADKALYKAKTDGRNRARQYLNPLYHKTKILKISDYN